MVIEVKKYRCEFAECDQEYDTKDEAQECQDKGLIGPEISPGLVLGSTNPLYCLILTGSFNKAHQRVYKAIQLSQSIDTFLSIEEICSKDDSFAKDNQVLFHYKQYESETFKALLMNKNIISIDNTYFNIIKGFIENGKSTELLRNLLKNDKVTDLYHSHPYLKQFK